jgi:hypothetical protein
MKTAILGCKGTTLDLLDRLRRHGRVTVDLVVRLSELIAAWNRAACFGGGRLRAEAEAAGIPVHDVRSYAMTDPDDAAFCAVTDIGRAARPGPGTAQPPEPTPRFTPARGALGREIRKGSMP